MTDEDLPHSTFQQFLTFLTNGFWTCGAMRSTKQWGVCVNAVAIAWVQFSVNCHPYSALVCISLAAVNFFAIPAGSYLYLINLNHSLRNLSRGRCCIPFVLACSRASMINAAQRRSININQNHFPLFSWLKLQCRTCRTCRTHLGKPRMALLYVLAGFNLMSLLLWLRRSWAGYSWIPRKAFQKHSIYNILWYEAILFYARRKSRGSSSCFCTSFSSFTAAILYR